MKGNQPDFSSICPSPTNSNSYDHCYSWEGPNLALANVIKNLVSPPKIGKTEIEPIQELVSGSKNDPLYMMHPYWSKKPFDAIRVFVEHFSSPGDLVLDPFLGCGSTAIVSALADRTVIGIDLSPSAMKIANGFCNNHPFQELRNLKDKVLKEIWKKIEWLYKIENQFIRSIIVSEKFQCIKCYEEMYLAALGLDEQKSECPKCKEKISTRTLEYLPNSGFPFLVELQKIPCSARGSQQFLVGKTKQFDQAFLDLFTRIEEAQELYGPPDRQVPQRLLDLGGRLQSTGTLFVSQLFSKRQRLILGEIKNVLQNYLCSKAAKRSFDFLFSSILLNSTQMYRVRKGGGGGVAGAYYVPPIRKEIDTFRSFAEKYDDLLKCCFSYPEEGIGGRVFLSRQSAQNLSFIPHNSIDYIFTDPPYADTMPYAALNAVYDYWFNTNSEYTKLEAIGENWKIVMAGFFKEAFRILKPGSWISLCYHDTSEGTWHEIQDLAAEAGLVCDKSENAVGIDTNQKAFQQTVADKVTKRDLVINFKKPLPGETTATLSQENGLLSFREKVKYVIRDFLIGHSGATKDYIYDDLISKMLRTGDLESHNFEEILKEVAEEVKEQSTFDNSNKSVSRWYLKETEATKVDEAETAKEEGAAKKLDGFAKKWLEAHPEEEGIHFSELRENYLFSVKDKDKTRRNIADWLPEFFFKTTSGTWRLPHGDEEKQLKSELRASGTHRRIKRFLSWLEQGLAVPLKERPNDSTLGDWIRQCKRAGWYDQGKILYEKGGINIDKLPEEVQVDVEEDYQVCCRMLGRLDPKDTGSNTAKKRGKKGGGKQ